MNGAQLIADERNRQIEHEKFSSVHDDAHRNGELVAAGVSYGLMAGVQANIPKAEWRDIDLNPPSTWPWDYDDWKPSDPIRNLVKAGALIAAEIDRLQRIP